MEFITYRTKEHVEALDHYLKTGDLRSLAILLTSNNEIFQTADDEEFWLGGIDLSLGCYSASDLNRVESNSQIIAQMLTRAGYIVSLVTKTDWVKEDIANEPNTGYLYDLTRYLGNVKKLLEGYFAKPTTPQLPENMDALTWEKANDIEQVLSDISDLIKNMENSYRYVGDYYCNEG